MPGRGHCCCAIVTRQLCIFPTGACAPALVGATVTISQGGVVQQTGTVGGGGSACFAVAPGTYDWEVSFAYWQTKTGTVTVTTANVNVNVSLDPVSGRTGCGVCAATNWTVPTALYATDSNGTVTLNYDGCNGLFSEWSGSQTVSATGYTGLSLFNNQICDNTTGGTFSWTIFYTLTCHPSPAEITLRKFAAVCFLGGSPSPTNHPSAGGEDGGITTHTSATCGPIAEVFAITGATLPELSSSVTVSE
jgi:hypothetical protein